MKLPYSCIAIICISLASCGDNGDSGSGRQAVYVKPSIDSRGILGTFTDNTLYVSLELY